MGIELAGEEHKGTFRVMKMFCILKRRLVKTSVKAYETVCIRPELLPYAVCQLYLNKK